MAQATDMIKWIENITVNKIKYDKLSDEEKAGLFPLGVLHEDNSHLEYTKAYAKVIEAAQNKTKIDFKEIV